jgi:O-6-methylguanine DNA methyltransferase
LRKILFATNFPPDQKFNAAVPDLQKPDHRKLYGSTSMATRTPRGQASLRGTAFQEAVWRELTRIPPGESLSYAALAAKAGRPGAARAAGTACGQNRIAILIPCHRARRGDGAPGGYAYGLDRKASLNAKEAAPNA